MSEDVSPNTIIVACACDDNYILPASVTLFSLAENLHPDSKVRFFIVGHGVSAANRTKIANVLKSCKATLSVDVAEFDSTLLRDLPPRGYVSVAAYIRMFLPKILPVEYEKLLYLDSDLLVLRDVTPLWNLDLSDDLVLASHDVWIPTVSSRGGVYNWRELGMDADMPYFNSGVLLMNLNEWRRRDIGVKLLNYINEHRDYLDHADQDALNAICYDAWSLFDMTWNAILLPLPDAKNWSPSPLKDYVLSHYDELWNHPSICHFAARWKPWTAGYRPPYQRQWFQAVKRMKWFTPTEYFIWHTCWVVQHYLNAFRRKFLGHKEPDRVLPSDTMNRGAAVKNA